MKTLRIPRTLNLSEGTDIKFSEGESGEKKRRIEMTAYSGKPVKFMGYTTVIDLSGVKMRKAKNPIYLEHDYTQRIGWSEGVENDGKKITVDGKLLSRSAHAEQVSADMADGFPWNVSMGFDIIKTKTIEAGAFAEVNGRNVKGPALIFSQIEVNEFSLTANGVDPNTTATMFSAANATAEPAQEIEVTIPAMDEPTEPTESNPAVAGEQDITMPDPITPVSAPTATPAPAPVAPEPATLDQLKAAFSADPAFVLDRLSEKATIADSYVKWSVKQAAEIERLTKLATVSAAVVTAQPVGVIAPQANVNPDEAKWSANEGDCQNRFMDKDSFILAQRLNRGEVPGFRNKTAAHRR